jgi:hypothetical protein
MRLNDKKIRARQIVDKIVDDLTDRAGLENVWEELDEDIQNEIKQEWQEIIISNLPSGEDDKDK